MVALSTASFQMGISSAMLRFSQRVVPMGGAVRRQSGNRQRIAEAGQHRGGDRLTKSGAASETTGGRFGLLAFTGWSGTSASDSRARPAPASCAPPAPDLYCCSFWRWLPAVPPRYHPAGSGLNGKRPSASRY